MPQHSASFEIENTSCEKLLAIALGTFKELNWETEFSNATSLRGKTKKTWVTYADEIVIECSDNSFTVTSTMTHGELSDLLGRNKKNIEKFRISFEQMLSLAPPENIQSWQNELTEITAATQRANEESMKLAEEVEKAMHLSTGNSHLTYTLIGINVFVFVLMLLNGINVIDPSANDIIDWGGSIGYLTTMGEWWRLITNMFVHIGIAHLFFNMYGLFFIGLFLEPMLGKTRFFIAYMSTGIFASLVSLWWHRNEITVSAGASGAIFGLYGLFFALLTTKLVPKAVRKVMLQSTAIFIGYNLIYGLKGGVDNAAHIGGLVSGAGTGYFFYYLLIEGQSRVKAQLFSVIVIIVTFGASFFALKEITSTPPVFASGKYIEGLQKLIAEFRPMDERALGVFERSNSLSIPAYINELRTISLKEWKNGKRLFESAKMKDLPPLVETIRGDFEKYCNLNVKRTRLMIKTFKENTPDYEDEIAQIDTEIETISSHFR